MEESMASLLILDDDEGTLAWMSAALTGLGHTVRAFRSGQEALVALARWRPELIISDILMPEMDGLTFVRLVRELHDVPVMFISIAKKQAEAVLAGAVGYVQKPATAQEVRAAVEQVLGKAAHRNSILVVDDDADIRDLYRTFLEPRFIVFDARDGQAALEVLHSQPIDLAIVDVHMPVMNGVELIRTMRDEEALQSVPVIVQTSDQPALKAPVWRDLHVSQVVDKLTFMQWLDAEIEDHTHATR
jgi:CheY-like chemotaxis protein